MTSRFARPVHVEMPSDRPVAASADLPGYAVVDLETSALSPRYGRIVEIAVVQVDRAGELQHAWTTLIDPRGPVGATHVHGIAQDDVIGAPTFEAVVETAAALLQGRAIVAHNAAFELRFLQAEFMLAGWEWPDPPHLCTMAEAGHFLPRLSRPRLVDACAAAGIRLDHAHSAHGDAVATARLLRHYLDRDAGVPPRPDHLALPRRAVAIKWPDRAARAAGSFAPAPAGPDPVVNRRIAQARELANHDASLIAALPSASNLAARCPAGTSAYVERVVDAIRHLDRGCDDAVPESLAALAAEHGIGERRLAIANEVIANAVADAALEDGVISRDERARVSALLAALGQNPGAVTALLNGAEARRLARLSAGCEPLPDDWSLGEPLRVRDAIAITGCDADRVALDVAARDAGLLVRSSVTRKTSVLVADGTVRGGKARDAAQLGTRVVAPAEAFELFRFVQPWDGGDDDHGAMGLVRLPVAGPPSGGSGDVGPREVDRSDRDREDSALAPRPSEVRAWARAQGIPVGERGRLSHALIARFLSETS